MSSVSREDLEAAARAALVLEARKKAAPLRYEQLWDSPRTSQRAAFATALSGGVQGLCMLGGNGTGKTRAAAVWALVMALGSDHPDVVAWAKLNGLDLSLVPKGPGRVWVCSPTFNAARDQIRRHLKNLAPVGTIRRSWQRAIEAELELPGGGVIVSKAYKQYIHDSDTWEGAEIRAVVFDEEPPSEECMGAAFARTRSTKAVGTADAPQRWFWMLAATLLNGENWLWSKYVEKPPTEVVVRYLHAEDSPHLDQAQHAAGVAATPEWQHETRRTGVVSMPVGRRLPVFSRSVHVVPHYEPPKDWVRWGGVDWGSYSPNYISVAEMDGGGALYVFREHAPRRKTEQPPITDAEFIEQCKLQDARDQGRITWRVADSADQGAVQEANRRGWYCLPAEKGPLSVEDGLDEIAKFLATTYQGQPRPPRLYISEQCPSLIKEMEQLKWLPNRPGKPPQTDDTCADHGLDGLRYILLLRRKMGRA